MYFLTHFFLLLKKEGQMNLKHSPFFLKNVYQIVKTCMILKDGTDKRVLSLVNHGRLCHVSTISGPDFSCHPGRIWHDADIIDFAR